MSGSVPSIRHNVFTRDPLHRGPYAARLAAGVPRWLRRLLLGLLLLLLLLALAVSCREQNKPDSLAMSTLEGPRLTIGPVCIEEAVDVSSSMTQYIPQREQAERELFTFAKRELQDQDLFSEAFFAGNAIAPLPPTSLRGLTAPPAAPAQLEDGTLLTPAVAALVATRGPQSAACSSRALVVITDGIIGDDPPAISAALQAANYTRMYAVVPGGATGRNRGYLNGGVLDSITVYGFREGGLAGRAASVLGDAKPLDVIFGEILSDLTGQRLAKVDRPPSAQPTAR